MSQERFKVLSSLLSSSVSKSARVRSKRPRTPQKAAQRTLLARTANTQKRWGLSLIRSLERCSRFTVQTDGFPNNLHQINRFFMNIQLKLMRNPLRLAWKKEKHIHRYREVPPIEHFALFVIEPSKRHADPLTTALALHRPPSPERARRPPGSQNLSRPDRGGTRAAAGSLSG